ncbi:hypothetical protein FE633_13430 [Streptomyces montanus]|uniref:DUF6545 domain-containing protein n=1 Tax=Streptomyces montanus TaxID=2580423 RepID=A0A5R9FWM2_9ACTN|nr:DUF6545 domain-containing protein [Streptomyces montanus]TLS45758.1 hypothetical protein FE633_13430 [Streptomyces montanus]
MLEPVLTAVNLAIFAVCATVGIAKAAAARSDRDTTLRVTASVLLVASVVYLLSAPAVYRLVGTVTGSPSLPTLLVSVAILLCVGHAHALTLLWHPRRRTPDAWRRSVTVWAPMYILAIAAMVVLFWAADLTGPAHPARPLSFATSYAHVPAALAFQLVFLTALVAGITVTVRQCRGRDGVIALPERPELADSLRLFAAAVALDLAYVACTATAVISASQGHHALDFLAAVGSVASSSSALVASYGLSKPALAARAAERADHRILLALWIALQTGRGSKPPRPAWWNRYALSDLLAEILDGTYRLRPWMSAAAAQAVKELAATRPDAHDLDLPSLQAAATIQHARQRRESGFPTSDSAPPHASTPPTLERARQVRIAAHLYHPLVTEALKTLTRVA